jgi:hypothetical protein
VSAIFAGLPRNDSWADSESGTLLDGDRLSDEQLQAFIQMLRRSYIAKAPRARTSPPSLSPDPPAQLEPATNPDPWLDPSSILMETASADPGIRTIMIAWFAQ